MDETLPTAWPDIIQREGARKQMAGRRAPRNEGQGFLRRVMLDRKTWPSHCRNWPSITDQTPHHPHWGYHFSLPVPSHRG
jgi:hypothetical protein